jgi:hypothetical protein
VGEDALAAGDLGEEVALLLGELASFTIPPTKSFSGAVSLRSLRRSS